MNDGAPTSETLTQVGQMEPAKEQPNPFNLIAEQNTHAGFTDTPSPNYTETQTPVAQVESRSPEAMAEEQMMEMRAQIEAAKAQAGGENVAGFHPQDMNETMMNATAPVNEEVPQQIIPPTLNNESKKVNWNWNEFDIRKFMDDFAAKMKLDKVVEVAKKIAQVPGKILKAVGRWWDVSTPKTA